MINLTGHDINICDHKGQIYKIIPKSKITLRANQRYKTIKKLKGVPIDIIDYTITDPLPVIKSLIENNQYIIVSKITAEALNKKGIYKGVLTTGRKFYLNDSLVGVRGLSLYEQGKN